ncbi:MAG: radical SAM protein [Patescibacteria group bacterium]
MVSDFEVKEVQAKSILVPSKLPDCDFVINPYTGCRFGCTYCYASFMGRYVGKDIKDWGNYVYAKINAPKLLKTEVKKLKNKGFGTNVFLSSVTDPYQGLEAKYKLTRGCLEVLLDAGFEGSIGILTKSDLVLRDMDIFKKLKSVEVGLTITSTKDSISRYFEKFAPSVSQRLEALKKLNEEGIKTYAFVGPLLPHFTANPESLREIFDSLCGVGVKELYIEHINLSPYIKKRLFEELHDAPEKALDKFYMAGSPSYRNELESLVSSILKNYNFKLRLGGILLHA